MSEKVAFLDRDGVINETAKAHDYIRSWCMFKLKEGAAEGIKILNQQGYKVVVVTNQRGIARKLMSIADLEDIHNNMRRVLSAKGAVIDAIFYCPHDYGECTCRKPDIGMFLQTEMVLCVDKKKSFIIGDSLSDLQAGENYGIDSYLLNSDGNLEYLVKNIINERME